MLGIALGAAAKSGVDTYEKILEAKRVKQENEARQRELDRQAAFTKAFEEQQAAQYEGGTETAALLGQALKFDDEQIKQLTGDFAKMPAEQQQVALRAYAKGGYANEGYEDTLKNIGVYKDPESGQALATSNYKTKSKADIARGVYDEMVKTGNMYGIQQASALYNTTRDMERTAEFDKTMAELKEDQVRLRTVLNDQGLAGVPDGMKDVLKDYGMKAEFVKGKNGHGSLKVTMPDGTPKIFNTGKDLERALVLGGSDVLMQRITPLAADAAEAASFIMNQWSMDQDKIRNRQTDRQIGISAGNLGMRRAEFGRQQEQDEEAAKAREDQLEISRFNAGRNRVDDNGNDVVQLPNGEVVSLVGTAYSKPEAADVFIDPVDRKTYSMRSDGQFVDANGSLAPDPARLMKPGRVSEATPEAMLASLTQGFIDNGYKDDNAEAMAEAIVSRRFGGEVSFGTGSGDTEQSRSNEQSGEGKKGVGFVNNASPTDMAVAAEQFPDLSENQIIGIAKNLDIPVKQLVNTPDILNQQLKKFKPGQIVVDADGNRATYIGFSENGSRMFETEDGSIVVGG